MLYSFLNKMFLWIEGPLWMFFKAHWKNFLLVAAIIYILFSINALKSKNKQIADLKAVQNYSDSVSNSKIKTWTDKYGAEHQRVENLVVTQQTLQKQVDSIADILKIKSSQITASSNTGIKIVVQEKLKLDTVTVKVPCDKTDSLNIVSKYEFHFKDPWINITGSIGVGEDSIHAEGTDTLKRTDYTRRTWFLAPKHYFTDFTNTNPHIKIADYKGVEFSNKVNHWSVGPSVMLGYPLNVPLQLSKPVIVAGIDLQYSLFRF